MAARSKELGSGIEPPVHQAESSRGGSPETTAELDHITEIIDLMAGHKLTKGQADYPEKLATLAADFEDQNTGALPKPAPHEFLAAHLDNIGLSASAWGELIGIDRSTASRLLRGERGPSATHIRNTAAALSIAPELMI